LLAEYKEVFDLIDRAACCETCDWKLLERLRRGGIGTPLPELDGARGFADLLAVRIRLEVTEGRFDEAMRDLQTGFTLARQIAEQPTLVNYTVGSAIATVFLRQLDTIVQEPGAPNLYWALTDLPRPLLNIRRSLQGERVVLRSTIPGFDELTAHPNPAPLLPEQVRKATDLAAWLLWDEVGTSIPDQLRFTRRWLLAFSFKSRHEAAKRALVAAGWPRERVEALPPVQVALLHSFHQYNLLWDEVMKWESFPDWEAYPHLQEVERKARQSREGGATGRDGNAPAVSLVRVFMPGVPKLVASRGRIDRKVAALRCLEAVRLYAARNRGRLPASLGVIKEVPIPVDPIIGKDFGYHVEGDRARLYGPPPPSSGSNPGNTITYELILKR
jgi:hypothetical protein